MGKYARERIFNPKKCDPRSFRTKKVPGRNIKVIICCPKGHWSPSKNHCRVGTRVQAVLRPIRRMR